MPTNPPVSVAAIAQLSEAKLLALAARAHMAHVELSAIWRALASDERLKEVAGGAMCSAAEISAALRTAVRGAAGGTASGKPTDEQIIAAVGSWKAPTYVVRNRLGGVETAWVLRQLKRLERAGKVERAPSSYAVMICWAIPTAHLLAPEDATNEGDGL